MLNADHLSTCSSLFVVLIFGMIIVIRMLMLMMVISSGHVEVEIGKENLMFESGPFNFFGVESLDCKYFC